MKNLLTIVPPLVGDQLDAGDTTDRAPIRLRWWQRALIWLAGVRAVETTSLDSDCKEWAKP